MLGLEENNISAGRVSYELRRLRLHGLIERVEGIHRYRLTTEGLRHVGLLSTHLCQNHPPGPLPYPQHLLPLSTCQWFAHSINSNEKSMLILSKRQPEKTCVIYTDFVGSRILVCWRARPSRNDCV